jgi:hypothetical protein
MKYASILAIFLVSCCWDPPLPVPPDGGGCGGMGLSSSSASSSSSSGAGGGVQSPPDPWFCQPPPYAQLNGTGFGSWASPTCSGDIARGEFAVGNNDALVHRCAQYLPSGEVWCVDPSAPVPAIYFKDPNQNGLCIEWTATSEPWFIWRSCGVKPIIPAVPVVDPRSMGAQS